MSSNNRWVILAPIGRACLWDHIKIGLLISNHNRELGETKKALQEKKEDNFVRISEHVQRTRQVEKVRLLPAHPCFSSYHRGKKSCLQLTASSSFFAINIIPGGALVPVHSSFVVLELAFASQ